MHMADHLAVPQPRRAISSGLMPAEKWQLPAKEEDALGQRGVMAQIKKNLTVWLHGYHNLNKLIYEICFSEGLDKLI